MNIRIFFGMMTAIVSLTQVTMLHGQAPKQVQETFEKMYPGENDPDWHLDKNGNYESNFKIKGIKYRADFRPNGQWIETENSISKKNLPYAIRKQIKKKYAKYKIVEVEKVEHYQKGFFYDVEFKHKKKKFDVEFTVNNSEQ